MTRDDIERMVRNEVFLNIDAMVRELLKADDEYAYSDAVCEATAVIMVNTAAGEECLEDAEVNQWLAVTDWLADKLQECGEIVLRDFHGHEVWGRQSGGQAIADDAVMHAIAQELHSDKS